MPGDEKIEVILEEDVELGPLVQLVNFYSAYEYQQYVAEGMSDERRRQILLESLAEVDGIRSALAPLKAEVGHKTTDVYPIISKGIRQQTHRGDNFQVTPREGSAFDPDRTSERLHFTGAELMALSAVIIHIAHAPAESASGGALLGVITTWLNMRGKRSITVKNGNRTIKVTGSINPDKVKEIQNLLIDREPSSVTPSAKELERNAKTSRAKAKSRSGTVTGSTKTKTYSSRT